MAEYVGRQEGGEAKTGEVIKVAKAGSIAQHTLQPAPKQPVSRPRRPDLDVIFDQH